MELVGRDLELAEVTARFRERRLVTITGPGGIGKTALARVAATVVGPEFEMGMVTVDLTRVDRPEAVGEAIAGQLGYADWQSLHSTPGDAPALIVLDNCEHVLDAAAAATAAILAGCEQPTILATSRSPLDLPDECVFTLGRLQTPAPDDTDAEVASLQLFLARADDNGAQVGPGDRALAAEVCRQLDGVPLALEIAAAQLRSRSLAELLTDLAERPHALARPRFRGKPSHRSVADMVGWSVDLLTADERAVFERMGVFRGPFTASMAHAVTGAPGADDRRTRELLGALVAASLVVADTTGDVTWFRLLHPVRAVAMNSLEHTGELAAIQSRLADHVVDLAIGVILRNSEGWDSPVLNDLLALYDNIAESLRWSLQHDEKSRRPMILLGVLWGVVHQAHTAEIGHLGESVLARWPDPTKRGWPDAAATVATCRYLLGDPESAIELAQSALPHAGSSPFAACSLRRVIAQASRAVRRLEDSRDYFEAGAIAGDERGVHGIAMELWVDYAIVLSELGESETALEVIDRVRTEALERHAAINAAWALAGRGAILARSDPAAAIPVMLDAITESRSIGYPAGVSFALRTLANARLQLGDVSGSAELILELIDELLRGGGLNELRTVLDTSAMIMEATGREAWVNVAATAAALPVTTVATPVDHDVFARSAERGRVLGLREAYVTCRRELRAIVDDRDPQVIPAVVPAGRASEAALVRDGDVWRFAFEGTSITVKAVKGIDDLATLLAEPEREFSSLDLMGSAIVSTRLDDEMLDARARREYEERIRQLQREIDEADADHDLARAERLRIEFDAIVDQLTAAVGLGGRSRRNTNDAERARSAVTQRLRATIKHIGELHPSLGRHLRSSIATGSFCRYQPPSPVVWRVER